ncbi:AbrB/MazE/SpoVT family DNA-binding domain-containing protein [Mesorhizobium sp. SARCC-RB16n]|uniref:antitoxin n=1 Tax=Mesorhizobium sp. SARCC-RB16n TaxID=2116687 RepID=UPI00122F09F1|nr:antitoxin [Mesorhizobium sp. SARCC-RB16n]KAA3452816.1 AbrB/MazE/SpoVT family DNA-binding domain-containing protein [Mesorhizobium sp. SARCC-RB16n]
MPQRQSTTSPKEAKLFRNNRSQAVRIPVEFKLSGDRVLISREGDRLIIEPVRKPGLAALLAQWAKEPQLGPEDGFPEINDAPVESEDIF